MYYRSFNNHTYRCACEPQVGAPSPDGPSYWSPPNFIPSIYKAKAQGNTKAPNAENISPYTMKHCIERYTYMWLNNGTEFWSVPLMIKDNYIYIWVWNEGKWTYYKFYR
jgi:hypothetical protein